MIKIAIVDDNTFLVNSTKEKLSFFKDFDVKFTANNGEEAIEQLLIKSNIDLILMDIEMPKMDGIEATCIIKSKFPHIKIIILTVFENDENIFNAIKAGADGYLLKEISPGDIYRSIIETYNGGAYMTPSIAQKTLRMFREPLNVENLQNPAGVNLTPRELDVLLQLSTGIKYELIATNLNIAPGTVRKHIENIYSKLHVCNKLEAIHKAKSNNLI